MGNDILNHIAYGHMGVTATVLGLFVFLQIGSTRVPVLTRLFALVTVGLGAFTILAAASRGALVAGLVLIPVVMYLGLRERAKLLTMGIFIILACVVSATAADLSLRGVDLGSLLGTAAAYSSTNESVYARQTMLRDAWRQYLDHPWFGSSMVERNSLSYPHNSFVEAFMATGTFGGAAFALLLLIAMFRAIRLLKRSPAMAWIPICFFQHLIGAMFSGGLYSNVPLWGMMAIMLGVRLPSSARTGVTPGSELELIGAT